jgi:hypothetical protein
MAVAAFLLNVPWFLILAGVLAAAAFWFLLMSRGTREPKTQSPPEPGNT